VAPLPIRQLIKMKLTDMFRISRFGFMTKNEQISSGILKKLVLECSFRVIASYSSKKAE